MIDAVMKKVLWTITIGSFFVMLTACGHKDQDDYLTGALSLPVAMSIDSSDGSVMIPYQSEGDSEAISWSSDDPEVVSVDAAGQVTVHKRGQAIITAQSGAYSASMKVIATYDKYTDYTRIRTKAEFLATFSHPANFNSPDKKYVLTTDIDFGGDRIEPIGGWDLSDQDTPYDPNRQFRATLDGRGFALKNFVISNPLTTKVDQSYFGVSLIPFILDGKVLNLNIIDATFEGTGFTGSIAGKILEGTIENCFVRATIISSSGNLGIPSGGIAGIVGPDAVIRNVILDVYVSGGFIYAGFNFGTGTNSIAVSETLADQDRRRPIMNTAITTNKGDEDEDAALKDFLDSVRIENEDLGNMDQYTLTPAAKETAWAISEGYMPFLIRADGMTPDWARLG